MLEKYTKKAGALRAPVILLQACGLALAVPPLAAAPYFGIEHTAVGNASLGTDPEGRLLIFDIGSSGQDGVAIEGGPDRRQTIDLDIGDRGALNHDLSVIIFPPTEISSTGLRIAEANGGSAVMGLVNLPSTDACVTVTLLDDGQVVDSLEFHGALPADLVTGDLGTDPVSRFPPDYWWGKFLWDFFYAYHQSQNSAMRITGSPTGDVSADEIRISIGGLQGAMSSSGPTTILAANLPGGTMAISGESLVATTSYATQCGFPDIEYAASSIDGSPIQGLMGPDICAGCPECCDPPGGDPMNQQAGWRLGGGGGAGGLLGVHVGIQCIETVHRAAFHAAGLDLDDDGDRVDLHATGTFSGAAAHDLGSLSLVRNGGAVLLDADYSPVGADQVRLVVRNQGTLVGFADVVAGTGVPLGEMYPQGVSMSVTKCGKLGGLGQPPCFLMCTQEPVLLVAGGQALLGDDIRILAMNTAGTLDGLDSFDITAQGIDQFVTSPVADVDSDGRPDIVVAGGSRVGELGDADADPTPDGRLIVSNIGSSGQDGVSVDLGRGEGATFRFGENELLEPGVSYQFRIGGQDVMRREQIDATWKVEEGTLRVLPSTGPDAVSPTTCRVDLFDDAGTRLATFTMDEFSPVGLSGNPGSALRIRELDAATPKLWEGRDTCGANPAETIRLAIDDGAGGAVAVLDPSGIPHTGVTQILASRDGLGGKRYSVGHVTIMKQRTAAPGTPTIEIDEIGTLAFDAAHFTVGGTRIVGEVCADGARRLPVNNLGSTGKDGVEVRFSDSRGSATYIGPCDASPPKPTGAQLSIDDDDDNDAIPTMEARAAYSLGSGGSLEHSVMLDGLHSPSVSVVTTSSDPASYDHALVRVRDSFGNVLAEEDGLALGLVATVEAGPGEVLRTPRDIYCSAKYDCALLPGSGGNSDVEIRFDAAVSATVFLPSGTSVSGASQLQICLMPAPGTPPMCSTFLDSVTITATGDGTPESGFDITREDPIYPDTTPPCPADLAPPYGILDLQDINAFVAGFLGHTSNADLDGNGIFDLVDINLFVSSFLAGCP